MPKSRAKKAPRPSGAPKTPVQMVRDAADALFRAATECCHQHDRVSRVHAKSDSVDELEAGQRACEHCDDVLRTMTTAYEEAAADVKPTGDDEKWWRNANGMWVGEPEYLRRNGGTRMPTADEGTRPRPAGGPANRVRARSVALLLCDTRPKRTSVSADRGVAMAPVLLKRAGKRARKRTPRNPWLVLRTPRSTVAACNLAVYPKDTRLNRIHG